MNRRRFELLNRETSANHFRLTKKLFSIAWLLIFLAGCGTYKPTLTSVPTAPSSTVVSIPTTAVQVLTPNSGTTALPSAANTLASSIDNVTQATLTAFPIIGSVEIEAGRCCLGGTAGDTVQAQVVFSATSPFGDVNRMRIQTNRCASETEMEIADWEPFVLSKTYLVAVALNWSGFYISVQFQDRNGNISPVYCDDISVEGSPPAPLVYPTDWFPQIHCISEDEVHPGPGATVTGANIIFNWPGRNNLPEDVYYKVFVYGAGDNYTALVASAQTRAETVILQIPPERAGDLVWYITLVDANGTAIDHSQCSSFTASLLSVDPQVGIKGIHFLYQP